MTIVRIDAEARWSDVVIHNNTLYYTGVPENLDADAFEQTANTLAQIDAVLEKQGSNKSRILDATLFLADKNDFAAMNKAWDAWVVAGHAPVRCTVQAGLMNPKYKVEIKKLSETIKELDSNVELFLMDNFYPAGDEQIMVKDITGKSIPAGGIPLDVDTVVSNVGTVINVYEAIEEKPVTKKYVSVFNDVCILLCKWNFRNVCSICIYTGNCYANF